MEENVLCHRGLLQISISCVLNQHLKVRVNKAINLKSTDVSSCSTIQHSKVKVQILPGQSHKTVFTTYSKNQPEGTVRVHEYNEEFLLDYSNQEMQRKRLCIHVYAVSDDVVGIKESLIGCFSFSLCSLTNENHLSAVDGWFFLLPADRGRTENVQIEMTKPRHLKRSSAFNRGFCIGDVCSENRRNDTRTTDFECTALDQTAQLNEGFIGSSYEECHPSSSQSEPCSTSISQTPVESVSNKLTLPPSITILPGCSCMIEQYFYQSHSCQLIEASCCSNSHLENRTSQGNYSDILETPSRHKSVTELCGRRKLDINNLQMKIRQLGFENLTLNRGLNLNRKKTFGCYQCHEDYAGSDISFSDTKTSVGCCKAGGIISTLKNHIRKLRHIKSPFSKKGRDRKLRKMHTNIKDGHRQHHTDNDNNMQGTANLAITRSTDFPDKKLRLTPLEMSAQNNTIEWDTPYRAGSCQRRCVDEDHKWSVQGNYALSFLGLGQEVESATRDVNFCSKPVLAVRRKVIGFHKDAKQTELGFSITDNFCVQRNNLSKTCDYCSNSNENIGITCESQDNNSGYKRAVTHEDKTSEQSFSFPVDSAECQCSGAFTLDEAFDMGRSNNNNSNGDNNSNNNHSISNADSITSSSNNNSSNNTSSNNNSSNCCDSNGSNSNNNSNNNSTITTSAPITDSSCVYITQVYPGSVAEDWGLEIGDVIIAVNHRDIRALNSQQVAHIIQNSLTKVVLEIERKTVVCIDNFRNDN